MKNNRLFKTLTLLALFAGAQILHAGSHTWSGGGGANKFWNNAANWSGGAPTAGEAAPVTLIFNSGPVCTNNIPGLTIDSLVLSGDGAVLHGSGGGTLIFRGNGGTNLVANGGFGASNTIAATLPVTLNGTNLFNVTNCLAVTIQSAIGGSGDLNLMGGDFLYFSGSQPNTRTGATTILRGFLMLSKTPGVNAIAGPLIIGDDDGVATGEFVILGASDQIPESVPVTVKANTYFRFAGFNETLGQIIFLGGNIETEGGLLTLTTNVVAKNANGFSGWIRGRLSLGGVTRTFDVTNSGGLVITAQISEGPAAAGIIKTGAGNLTLSGTNTYTGSTMVNGGTVEAEADQAFGTTAGGVTIATNCTLWLHGANVGAEALTLAGTVDSTSTNSWAGNIVLQNGDFIITSDVLTLSGALSGPAKLVKNGSATLVLSGTSANTHAGGTTVNDGTLQLNKTGVVAVPGPLYIGSGGFAYSDVVQLLQPNQIADSAAVIMADSGLFDLNNLSETIGSLAGGGYVSLLQATLITGGDNTSTAFSGTIGGIGFSPLIKNGSGTFTLNGTNTCSGTTAVNGGKLVVNGILPGFLQMNFFSSLGGTGTVGNLTATLGHIAPGNSVGKINTGNLSLNNGSSSLDAQINGSVAGTGYDQIVVAGSVSLSNPSLNLTLGFPGAVANKYILINNDGNKDAVSGTFNNLPEGATFTNNGALFQISYQGGDGNDVELTQLSVNAPLVLGSLQKLGNGQMKLIGSGFPNASYTIQANANLATTNWTNIGSVQADLNGAFNFTDTNAPSFQQRYYRFTAP